MNRKNKILLPISVALFIMLVLTFPLAVYGSMADRSESPEHILTYKGYKLTWDAGTDVNKDGVAELSLFDSIYQNVDSDDGGKILAPGTSLDGDCIVRLHNDDSRDIRYTAVVYYKKSSDELPIAVGLSNDAGTDTSDYAVPDSVGDAEIAKAVKGSLTAGKTQDFDLNWYWTYEDNDSQNTLDTKLGDKAAWGEADDVTAGIYIVVEVDDADEPTSTEEPTTSKEPVTTEEPTTAEEPTTTEEPTTAEEPTTTEAPTTAEEPTTADESTTADEKAATESVANGRGTVVTPSPNTGDDSMASGYAVLLLMSGVMIVILAIVRRKDRKNEE